MKRYTLILTSLFLVFLIACEKKEKLYPKPVVPAGIQFQTVSLGDNYENQIWFSIQDQQMYINRHDGWDLAFATDESNRIMINGGKSGTTGVASYAGGDFKSVTGIPSDFLSKLQFDNPSGEPDSQVFNGWSQTGVAGVYMAKDILYLMDLGDKILDSTRYIKMQMISRTNGVYHLMWSVISRYPVPLHYVDITVDPDYNFMYYNFSSESVVQNEMVTKDKWDFVFTTYKQYIPDPNNNNKPYPYILRGVLSNPNKVKVFEIPNTNLGTWDQVTLAYAMSVPFSEKLDEIGYDWKIWNMSANKYTMANKMYVIKDVRDNYFKFRFVDFYDDNGNKGFPKMAWELLK